MNAGEFVDLVRRITHRESHVRERGADEAADWPSAYSPAEAAALATVLSSTAACEQDRAVLEAQLHALVELASTGHIEAGPVSHLYGINPEALPASLREYVADLLELDAELRKR